MLNDKRINNITNIIGTIIRMRTQIFILNQYINNSIFKETKEELEKDLILNKQMLTKFIKDKNIIYLTN